MKFTDFFREKADKAKDSASSALDKTAEAKQKVTEIKDRFAPAIKDLTDEAGHLAKEAESEIKYLKDREKSGGIGALIKKPDEDDILALSRKARRKANKLERKAAKLEKKLRKIEKKQRKALKKYEQEQKQEQE